jgi:hypothetical protein
MFDPKGGPTGPTVAAYREFAAGVLEDAAETALEDREIPAKSAFSGSNRGGLMEVASAQTIEAEVIVVEMALDYPPTKADIFATVVSVLGALGLILKTVASPIDHYGPKDIGLIVASAVLGIAQATRYVMALRAKTPIKDRAKKYIRQWRIDQGWKPEDEEDPTRPSPWKHLDNLMWARLFKRLGDDTWKPK